jgi:hypothetical protein
MAGKKMGRPTKLTEAVRAEILDRIAMGETLREICRDAHMPNRLAVFRRVRDDIEFRDQYVRAKEFQLEVMEDDLIDIADNGTNDWIERRKQNGEVIGYIVNGEHIQRSRTRIDARKWVMSKRLPKKYGDRAIMSADGAGQDDSGQEARVLTLQWVPVKSPHVES